MKSLVPRRPGLTGVRQLEMTALNNGFAYMLVVFGDALAIAMVFNAVAMNVSEEGWTWPR